MTLPVNGSISLSQVNQELGISPTNSIGLGSPAVRYLAGVLSGQIAMSNLRGKTTWTPYLDPANQFQVVNSFSFQFGVTCLGAPIGSTFSWSLDSSQGNWNIISVSNSNFLTVTAQGSSTAANVFCTVTHLGVSKIASGTLGHLDLGF
jgi:hypothetical protein